MDKEVVSNLKLLTGSEEWKSILSYVEWRERLHKEQMLSCRSYEEVVRCQAAITEIRLLKTLRDQVLQREKDLLNVRK